MSESRFKHSLKEDHINYDYLCINTSDTKILKSAGIITDNSVIFVYFIWYPTVGVIGIVGNFLSIIIFKKQFRNKQVYHMQLLIMITDLIISIENLS